MAVTASTVHYRPPATGAPTVRHTGRPSRFSAWLAVIPGLAALAICMVEAADREMWNNEYATWHAASLPLPALGRLLGHTDLVHTAYYLFMHWWIVAFGDSPLVLRLPSVLAMSGAAVAVALVGRRLVNTGVGVVAGLLFAVIPSVTRYAQETRAYALVTMGAAVTTLLLLRALEKPTRSRWFGYALVVIVIGWLHFASLIVVAGHGLLVLGRTSGDDTRRWRWVGSAGTAALLVIPLLSFASRQSASISWIKADGPAVAHFPVEMFASWRVAAAVAALAALGAVLLWRVDRPATAMLVTWAVLPPLFCYLTFPLLHMFLARYVLFTLPAWSILAAAALYRLGSLLLRQPAGHRWLVVAALVLPAVAYLAMPDQRLLRESPVRGQPDYRAAVEVMHDGLQPGDGVAYNDIFGALSDLARQAVAYELRDGPRPRDVFLAVTPQARGSFSATECADPVACLGDTRRIWLISTTYSPDPFSGLPADKGRLLRRQFTTGQDRKFTGVRIVLLTRKA